MKLIYLYKVLQRIRNYFALKCSSLITKIKFIFMGVQYSKFKSVGIPIIDLSIRKPSYIELGRDVKLNNGELNNQIGFGSMKCTLIAENGKIIIGNKK